MGWGGVRGGEGHKTRLTQRSSYLTFNAQLAVKVTHHSEAKVIKSQVKVGFAV